MQEINDIVRQLTATLTKAGFTLPQLTQTPAAAAAQPLQPLAQGRGVPVPVPVDIQPVPVPVVQAPPKAVPAPVHMATLAPPAPSTEMELEKTAAAVDGVEKAEGFKCFDVSATGRPMSADTVSVALPTLERYSLVLAIDFLQFVLKAMQAKLPDDEIVGYLSAKVVNMTPTQLQFMLTVIGREQQVPPELYDAVVANVHQFLLDQALACKNQDAFALMLKPRLSASGLTRDQMRNIFKAARKTLADRGLWKTEIGGAFQQQAEALSDARVEKAENPERGEALKQLKMDNAANAKAPMVQIARRIARELAAHGPISIDDVTLAMARDMKVATGEGDGAHNWKGKVFAGAEWIAVGSVASRIPEAHKRPVKLWALKTWLNQNTLNGSASSAYNLAKIFSDFKRAHPGMKLDHCNWYLGDEQMSTDVRNSIVSAGMKLYEIPVAFMAGGVGAVLLAPDYARTVPVAPVTSAAAQSE